jgi:hypothetical protein
MELAEVDAVERQVRHRRRVHLGRRALAVSLAKKAWAVSE